MRLNAKRALKKNECVCDRGLKTKFIATLALFWGNDHSLVAEGKVRRENPDQHHKSVIVRRSGKVVSKIGHRFDNLR